MPKGTLTLIPTPIADDAPLEPVALALLLQVVTERESEIFIVVEEHKEARRRWLKWGLPRETIEAFVLFNEHNMHTQVDVLMRALKNGKDLFLMSDGGLPAFCDPGRELVDRAHRAGFKVTATPFCNSISLAVALSGFPHQEFHFYGFPPREEDKRTPFWSKLVKTECTVVVMDTPYRLKRTFDELKHIFEQTKIRREICLAFDLGRSTERVIRGDLSVFTEEIRSQKGEFILLLR